MTSSDTPQEAARRGQRGITLVELLIGITIASLLATMMLGTWFALSDSYSFTVRSDKARDKARQTMSRMQREIRDAENRRDIAEVAILRARPWYVVLYTTFNKDGNEFLGTKPRLVMYRLYSDGELWRYHDANGNSILELRPGVSMEYTNETWPALSSNTTERETGEGAQLMTDDVVNMKVPSAPGLPSATSPTPLFHYSYYNNDGSLSLDYKVTGTINRQRIKSIEIHLLVDTNPEHSPVYTNLKTTAQLRNQR